MDFRAFRSIRNPEDTVPRATSPLARARHTETGKRRGLAVRDFMTPREALVTVAPDTTLRELAELLSTRHVAGAPVLAGSVVVGVVSASDLVEFAATAPGMSVDDEEPDLLRQWDAWGDEPGAEAGGDARAELLAGGWLPEGDPLAAHAEPNGFDEHTAEEVMTTRLVTVSPDAPLRDAAERMRAAGVHRLLVMEGGALVGMITSTDVLRAVAEA